jgi:CheY-like chemotaxis protein
LIDGGVLLPDSTEHKILVVADESDCRVFLSNILNGAGFESIRADNTAKGLELAASEKPAVIILDVMMPDKEGIKMYHRLKNAQPLKEIPVIMLSAIDRDTFYLYEKFKSGRWEAGVPEPEGFLEKPPEADDLIRLVSRLMASGAKKADAAALKKELKSNELVRTHD